MANSSTNELLAQTENLCGKCLGTGRLTWTGYANGVCFDCKGAGRLSNASARGRALAMTFAGSEAGVVWQFGAYDASGYRIVDAKPGDDRTNGVIFQAIAINAAAPRRSRTAFRAAVSPDVGRKAARAAKAGATVAEIIELVGAPKPGERIPPGTPCAWFTHDRAGVSVLR